MKSRAKDGKWNGGHIPYGYDWNKETKTVSLNEKEAKIVRLLFDLFNEKQNLKHVANALNDMGYRTRNGNKWGPVTVRHILTSVWYTGTYLYNKCNNARHSELKDPDEWVYHAEDHQALVSQEEYERHIYTLSQNRRGGHKIGDTYDTRFVHIFAGLIICGNCGANVTANRGKAHASGWIPTTYGCATRRKQGDKCSNKFKNEVYFSSFMVPLISSIINAKALIGPSTTVESLEAMILKQMEHPVKRITGLGPLLDLMRSNEKAINYFFPLPSELKSGKDALDNLRSQKRKTEMQMQRLQSLYLHGDNVMTESDYIAERSTLMRDLAVIDKRLSELSSVGEMTSDEFVLQASSFVMIDKLINYKKGTSMKLISTIDPRVPQHFFRAIISRIVLTSGNITEIIFKNAVSIKFEY